MIKMCDEMVKLRNMLDSMGVEWFDNSDVTPMDLIKAEVALGIPENHVDTTIYRTYFMANGHMVSAIHGYGTYGGYEPFRDIDYGLLEVMLNLDMMSGQRGNMTAEDVIKECFGEEKSHDYL